MSADTYYPALWAGDNYFQGPFFYSYIDFAHADFGFMQSG